MKEDGNPMKVFRSHLLLCGGTGCHASGSLMVKKALVAELVKRNLSEEIKLVETGCNGFCAQGPHHGGLPRGCYLYDDSSRRTCRSW
jgi:NADH:ubiquinone oxidoreductase subunit E